MPRKYIRRNFDGPSADPEYRRQRGRDARAVALSVDTAIKRVEQHAGDLTPEHRTRIYELASQLPPLTPDEVAAAGQLAAELDARLSQQQAAS